MTIDRRRAARALWIALLVIAAGSAGVRVGAQAQMPDPRQISGVPLPDPSLPIGTVSVIVIRGSFEKPIADQPVEITVDGKARTEKTNASGRVEPTGLAPGARVKIVLTVDGERLESQDFTVPTSGGIRVAMAATDPEAARQAEQDKRLAAGPAVKGIVVLGPESRVVAQFSDDRLNIFYVLDIQNTARTPVDIGGPLTFDLPREARGTGLMDGSSGQATASGSRLTVTGPFAPGSTLVQVGFELPYSGATAHLRQQWPAALQQATVLVTQIGGLDVRSPQLTAKQNVSDQGQPLIFASGPGLPAGQTLDLDITGLPHHAVWPRYVALSLAAAIMGAGLWAAAFVTPGRRTT